MLMKQEGFTLVETLIAMVLLALGALALAQLLTAGVWINARTKDDFQIHTVAQEYLEQLYDSRYANLPVGGDLYSAEPGYSLQDIKLEAGASVADVQSFHQNEITYDIYWQISDAGSVSNIPLKEIAVRVVSKRMDLGATQREITVKTQISRLF